MVSAPPVLSSSFSAGSDAKSRPATGVGATGARPPAPTKLLPLADKRRCRSRADTRVPPSPPPSSLASSACASPFSPLLAPMRAGSAATASMSGVAPKRLVARSSCVGSTFSASAASHSADTSSMLPCTAAHMSGVMRCSVSCAVSEVGLMSRWRSSTRAMFTALYLAASSRGVEPVVVGVLGLAPAARSTATIARLRRRIA